MTGSGDTLRQFKLIGVVCLFSPPQAPRYKVPVLALLRLVFFYLAFELQNIFLELHFASLEISFAGFKLQLF